MNISDPDKFLETKKLDNKNIYHATWGTKIGKYEYFDVSVYSKSFSAYLYLHVRNIADLD